MALKRILWGAVVVYTALHLAYSVAQYSIFSGASSGDFNRVVQETMEWQQAGALSPDSMVLHPPLYYLFILGTKAVLGSREGLAFFFYFTQFLLFPAAIAFMVHAVYGSFRAGWVPYLVASALVINFQPLLETLAQFKVEGIEFFLICLAVVWFQKGWHVGCGAVTLIAANLKYLPGILLVYFLVKRQWRVLRGGIYAGILVLALLAVAGVNSFDLLVRHPADLVLNPHKHAENSLVASVEMQTLTKAVYRWLAETDPPETFAHRLRHGDYVPVERSKIPLAIALASGLRLAAVAAYLFLIWRPPARWELSLLEISLSLVMIPMLIQASRVHYAILVLPAFVFAGLLLLREGSRYRLPEKLLFAGGYALTGMIIPGGLLNKLPPHPVWGQMHSWMYFWWSLPFYGIVLLGVSILWMRRRMLKAPQPVMAPSGLR